MNNVVECVNGISNLRFLDTHPRVESFRSYVFEGLSKSPKELASKFLYDHSGSQLFDKICAQPEYYQTNAELEVLERYGKDIINRNGPTLLVELGSGNSRKIKHLLDYLEAGDVFVPVDISREYLLDHAGKIAREYPHLRVAALCADFLGKLQIPVNIADFENKIIFFPGSTLGNFEPETQKRILRNCVDVAESGGRLVIGMDKNNAPEVLNAAYNDAAGVTAAFELNILARINRELGANFNLETFSYRGFYNPEASRVEMHLVSQINQTVVIEDTPFHFAAGEQIHVENSYKYEPQDFDAICSEIGMNTELRRTDSRNMFNVYEMVVR